MRLFTHAEYDAALAEAIERLPAGRSRQLGDAVIRVEQMPRAREGSRRRPACGSSSTASRRSHRRATSSELRRLARADLVRALVWQLDLEEETAGELSRDPVAFSRA